MDKKSLSHTAWKCQYHIVFIPKYRKKKLYGSVRADVRDIIKTLCHYKHRSRAFVRLHSAQNECIEFHGVPEGEKRPYDF